MERLKGNVLGALAASSAATGAGMKAVGLYSIVNATTGATMLASTAAGSSAAGTVGILAGTSGVIGAVGGFLMAPAVIVGSSCVVAAIYGPKIYSKFKSK